MSTQRPSRLNRMLQRPPPPPPAPLFKLKMMNSDSMLLIATTGRILVDSAPYLGQPLAGRGCNGERSLPLEIPDDRVALGVANRWYLLVVAMVPGRQTVACSEER